MLRMVWTLAFSILTVQAQSPSVAATWKVTIEEYHGTTDGGGTFDSPAIEGTLVLTQKDDVVSGTWASRQRWTVSGTFRDGRLQLTSESRDIPTVRDGVAGTVKGRWRFDGAENNGALSGTATLEIESRSSPARTWRAKRA